MHAAYRSKWQWDGSDDEEVKDYYDVLDSEYSGPEDPEEESPVPKSESELSDELEDVKRITVKDTKEDVIFHKRCAFAANHDPERFEDAGACGLLFFASWCSNE